eukprot:2717920-Rhodomonas_salina.2
MNPPIARALLPQHGHGPSFRLSVCQCGSAKTPTRFRKPHTYPPTHLQTAQTTQHPTIWPKLLSPTNHHLSNTSPAHDLTSQARQEQSRCFLAPPAPPPIHGAKTVLGGQLLRTPR